MLSILEAYSLEESIINSNLGVILSFIALSSVKSCMIFGPKNTSRPIGSHVDKIVTFDIEEYDFTTAVLKCYWGMANEGILSIGAQDGLRELESITITRAK